MRGTRGFLLAASTLVTSTAFAQITPNTQAFNPDAVALQNSADLVVKDLGLSPAGEISFSLLNRGAVGVNTKGSANTARLAPAGNGSGPQIRLDVYMGGTLIESLYQSAIAGHGTRPYLVKPQANVPKCRESRDLKVVIDAPNAIVELHDDNNMAAQTVTRPCPDLAVLKIERASQGVTGEMYQAKVTIANLGDVASPATQAWATSLSSAPAITGWPEFGPNEAIPALAPGQKHSFRVGGSVFSVDNSWVSVFLDRHLVIDEPNESNNRMNKKL
jgi:hypothetical protein